MQHNPTSARSDRPEAAVVNEIDRLIDDSLAAGDVSHTWDEPLADARCRCGREWHGLPTGHCPGADAEGPVGQPELAGDLLGMAELREMARQTRIPEQVLPPVPMTQWAMVPNLIVLQANPLIMDEIHTELVDAVLAMLGEVCGIFLPDSNIEHVIAAVNDMATAARENRERRERIRCHLLSYDTAPPDGYTLADLQEMREDIARHAHHRRQAMQRLPRRRDREQATAGDQRRRQPEARPEVCDPSTGAEETQQATGA